MIVVTFEFYLGLELRMEAIWSLEYKSCSSAKVHQHLNRGITFYIQLQPSQTGQNYGQMGSEAKVNNEVTTTFKPRVCHKTDLL